MDSYTVVYILIAIGFASAIYLLIYAWRHPPEQQIRQKTDDKHSIQVDKHSIQVDLKELQQKYDIIVGDLAEIKSAVIDLKNLLSKNGLI